MALHNDIGKWGEDIAAEYLRSKGWYIRHRNWTFRHRELDLVCIDEDMTTILVVEVKTRSTADFGEPDQAITLEKRHFLLSATNSYIHDHHLEHMNVRFDTISIVGTPDTTHTIEHKENAFDIVSDMWYKEQKRRFAYYRRKHRDGCW